MKNNICKRCRKVLEVRIRQLKRYNRKYGECYTRDLCIDELKFLLGGQKS